MIRRSLVPWGFDPSEDEELRWYFEAGHSPATLAAEDRASAAEWMIDTYGSGSYQFQDLYVPRRPERRALSSLMAAAAMLPAAIETFADLKFPFGPGAGDADARRKWAVDGEQGLLFVTWLNELEANQVSGHNHKREAWAFDRIKEETDKSLFELAHRWDRNRSAYLAREAFLKREDDRRRRDELDEAGALAKAANPPIPRALERPRHERRKYGQLPRAPEVFAYRPNKRS